MSDRGEAHPLLRTAYRARLLILLLATNTLSFVDRAIMAVAVDPMRRDLLLSDAQIGLLQGLAFAVTYALIGLPVGRLAERRNRLWIIGAAVIVYGAEGKPTPLGTFPITQKDARHVSTIYDVSMPYMLRLTNDGVSIHGTTVLLNKGSSGCVGVPVPFAAKLFRQAHIGDRVIITDGKTLHMGDPIIKS